MFNYRTVGFFMFDVISTLLNIYSWVVLAYSLLSWVLSPFHPIRKFVNAIVDPALYPIRWLMSKIFKGQPAMRFDFSPVILILLIGLLRTILGQIITFLYY